MVRRSARRAPRVVWLPQDPFFSVDAATLAGSTVMRVSETLVANNQGDFVTNVIPVIRDASPNPLTTANSLADIYQSGYRLRRIVGKMWPFYQQAATNTPEAVVLSAGFIILRTDPGASANPQNIDPSVYSTNDILNTESPWIWRRSWMLLNTISDNVQQFGSPTLGIQSGGNPCQTVGGNADGPHIDQKTARIVGPDERLFLVTTYTSVSGVLNGQADPANFELVYDLRILGSLRSNVGNRRNASR